MYSVSTKCEHTLGDASLVEKWKCFHTLKYACVMQAKSGQSKRFPSTVCAECLSNLEKKCWHAQAAKNASMGLVKHCLQLHVRIGFVAGARNYLRYYYVDCRRFSLLTMGLCKYLITATCGGVMWDGSSCASWLLMNLPHNVRIPPRLACRRPFCALPADYPTNTEVEARERASAADSYDDQQVSAHCGKEQLLGKGRAGYADGLSVDCLRKNNHNVDDTIPERVTWLQSLHTHLSFAQASIRTYTVDPLVKSIKTISNSRDAPRMLGVSFKNPVDLCGGQSEWDDKSRIRMYICGRQSAYM